MSEIKNTINTEEINKFSRLADEWWKAEGKFKTLHKFNPIRLKFIIDQTITIFKCDEKSDQPLKGIKILDYWLWRWIALRATCSLRCKRHRC